MAIAIRIGRDADIEAARKLTLAVAQETVGEKAVNGVFLTKIEATAAVLELRLQAPDAASRDLWRAELLAKLAQRFAQANIGASASERPSFS
jgi:small-conductance mechanosensitive channel